MGSAVSTRLSRYASCPLFHMLISKKHIGGAGSFFTDCAAKIGCGSEKLVSPRTRFGRYPGRGSGRSQAQRAPGQQAAPQYGQAALAAILNRDGTQVATFPGWTRDPSALVAFAPGNYFWFFRSSARRSTYSSGTCERTSLVLRLITRTTNRLVSGSFWKRNSFSAPNISVPLIALTA